MFVEAIANGDARISRLWLDVTTVAVPGASAEQLQHVATRIRQLGIHRILYGSDAPTPTNLPQRGWALFRRLPLTEDEFTTIANNVPPYMR